MKLILLIASVLALALSAAAETIAITNGRIITSTDRGIIPSGTVIIRDGKIVSVGPTATTTLPTGARVINADGKWVTPGIISPYSQIGIVEVGAESSTNDTGAGGSKYSIALEASRGFNPNATTIAVTRIEGVTRIVVSPTARGSIFGGQGFVADTSGKPASITKDNAFTVVELGQRGAQAAGGSRPAAWAFLEAAISDARTFPARYISHDAGDAISRMDAIAFGPASRGQQLMLVRVERASDILQVIQLKKDKPELRLAILGASEGWMVADEIATSRIPVIINPFANLPSSFEMLGASMQNAKRLHEAGVIVAYYYGDDSTHQARLVLQAAGNAVAQGVDYETAFQAITRAPAFIYGLSDLGYLAPNARADVVVWDGDPLEVTSAPTLILIDGEEVSLESRQTRLRDRYSGLDTNQRPLSYKRD